MASNSDIIDVARLLDLRPAGIRNHLYADEELLPMAPGSLLPKLAAPLLEIPASLGTMLEPALRAAASVDAPIVIGLDAEAGHDVPGPRGLHAAVENALNAVRSASYRLPFVLHARLGMVDSDDEQSVDAARIKVLEALDAGVTSVQLGVFGDGDQAAKLLSDVLRPVGDNGLGIVVTLADSYQAESLPGMLAPLEVDAFSTTHPALKRRDAIAVKPVAPFPAWADATGALTQVLKTALKDASLETLSDEQKDRVEMKVFGAVEDLVKALKAKGSAGKVMVALSNAEESWPIPE